MKDYKTKGPKWKHPKYNQKSIFANFFYIILIISKQNGPIRDHNLNFPKDEKSRTFFSTYHIRKLSNV